MKNTSTLKKRLAAYSALSGAALLAPQLSRAQILYTDLEPDAVVTLDTEPYSLDLNNDGTADFLVQLFSGLDGGYYIADLLNPYTSALPAGEVMGVEMPNGVDFAQVVNFEEEIGAMQNWRPAGSLLSSRVFLDTWPAGYTYNGFWEGQQDKYLGLRIEANGNLYYGWARLDVFNKVKFIKVKDYAVNQVADQSIYAGQKMAAGCSDSNEPNNTYQQATAINAGESDHGLINPSGDIDVFGIAVTNDEPNLRVILSNLPANYDLNMYNSAGQKIGASKKKGKTNDTIVLNNLTAGIYYARVFGSNGKFDADDCFIISAETSTDPFRLTSEKNNPAALFDFSVYPNPASASAAIWVEEEMKSASVLSVVDLAGRKLMHEVLAPMMAGEKKPLDVSALPEGTYLLKLETAAGMAVKKIVVSR